MLRGLIGAAAIGAVVMFVLDPDRGRRRRAVVRDKVVRAARRTGDAVDTTSRDMTNRARGVVAELRGRLTSPPVSDQVLAERVRARIGVVVGRASSIETTVEQGRVTLRGPVLAHEVDRLLRRVRGVRGVKEVADELEVHDEPGSVPGLQGRPRPPRGGEVFDLMQENWSPTTRFLTGLGAGAMTAWGLRRFDPLGVAVALVGFGLLTRAAANAPLARLTGVNAAAARAAAELGRP